MTRPSTRGRSTRARRAQWHDGGLPRPARLRRPAHAVRGQVRRLHRLLGLGESRRARRRLGRALSFARLRLQALLLVRLHASGARRAARPGPGRAAHRRSGRAHRPALPEERRAHDRRQPAQVALRAVHPAGGPRLRARHHRRHPVRPDAPSGGRAPSPRHDVRRRTPSSTPAIRRDTRRSSSCRSRTAARLPAGWRHARGTRENPLTADEVRDKYARLTAPVVPRRAVGSHPGRRSTASIGRPPSRA